MVMLLLISGDALRGQGVMRNAPLRARGHRTGSVYFIVNNQIGYHPSALFAVAIRPTSPR